MSQHFYVIENPLGEFQSGPSLPKHSHVCGRFASRKVAKEHAAKLKRDYLSPAFDKNGNPLTPRERAVMGVWDPAAYEQALARGRAHLAVTA